MNYHGINIQTIITLIVLCRLLVEEKCIFLKKNYYLKDTDPVFFCFTSL